MRSDRTTRYGARIDVITPKTVPCLSRCYERNIVELITCTAHCTCHHVKNLRKKLKFPGELGNSKQICMGI